MALEHNTWIDLRAETQYNSATMPLPLIPIVIGALLGSAAKKKDKKKAVSGYTTKKGRKVKAYLKKAK